MAHQNLSREWLDRIEHLDFAFQPIVNIHTGVCFAYEALLRNWTEAGFSSIDAVFNLAHSEDLLHHVDLLLRKKAIEKFRKIEWSRYVKLFYNLDNRIFDAPDYQDGQTLQIIKANGLSQSNFCFEISEKHRLKNEESAVLSFCAYRRQGFRIAVDDCGTGFSGLKMLYHSEPDYIKIDRFFIKEIETDARKRLFVSSLVEIAHLMGSLVVAEGVETTHEYYGCRSIGCDLVQGYFVQKPTQDILQLRKNYDAIALVAQADRRFAAGADQALIKTEITHIPSIREDQDIVTVFEKFRENKHLTFFPVVDENNHPLGVIRETAFKDFAYSRYGRQLLENPSFGKSLFHFVSNFPSADISTPIEKVLKIFAQDEHLEGLLMLKDMKYIGFLSAHSLLRILNEKNLAAARDQNPLTRLPGNTIIHEFISTALQDCDHRYHFIQFDFDNFKVFNDHYGFRTGDRLILRFAELLAGFEGLSEKLVGHIGGDDFFLGLKEQDIEEVTRCVRLLSSRFYRDAESFYDSEAIANGYIIAKDRDGVEKKFPLVTVSTSVLSVPAGYRPLDTVELIGRKMADLKKTAKQSEEKLCVDELQTSLFHTASLLS